VVVGCTARLVEVITMNGYNNHDFIALLVFVVAMVSIVFLMAYPKNESVETVETVIPSNYHIFYDDENKMIIAPKEYHFTYDEKGDMILNK